MPSVWAIEIEEEQEEEQEEEEEEEEEEEQEKEQEETSSLFRTGETRQPGLQVDDGHGEQLLLCWKSATSMGA